MRIQHLLKRPENLLFGLIIVAYLVLGALYAIRTPAWQVPDEPAHYNYVAQIAWIGLPVLEPDDWDSEYLERIKASGFKPDTLEGRLNTIQYEDHQPPLYYLLAAPLFQIFDGNLIALRLFSVILGAGVVICAFLTVQRLFPAQPYLALGTAAFVAFLPQHLAMMAGVNNDCLAELIVAATLYTGVRWLTAPDTRHAGRYALILGVLLGLAFITKATAYGLIFVVGAAFLLRARREKLPASRVIRLFVIAAIPALILGGAWWLRNVDVYGVPDVLGLRRHDSVVIGQKRTADVIAEQGFRGYLSNAVQTTFESFWGRFGWMGVVLPRNIASFLVIFNSFALMGASVAFVQFRALVSALQWDGLVLLILSAGLAVALFLYYNLQFAQWQGRYTYTGLIAFGLYFTAALTGYGSLVPGKTARCVLILSGAGVLFGFAVYALFRIIVPNLPNFG